MHNLWIKDQSEWVNITPLLSNLSWSSSLGTLGDQLNFDIISSNRKYIPHVDIDVGQIVRLQNKEELYRGEIFTTRLSGNDIKSFDTFDYAFFLNKSKDIYQFNKISANKAIERLLEDYKIPQGAIVSIPMTVDKLYANKSIAGIIKDILQLASEQLGKKYLLEMYKGRLSIVEEPKEPIQLGFRLASNLPEHDSTLFIQNPSRSRSITNMKNSIKIISGQEVLLKEQNANYIAEYGLLQEVRSISEEEKVKAKTIASNLLKDLGRITEENSLTLPGHDEVRAGRLLEIREDVTGMKGTYRVKNCTHTIENGHHSMNLTVEKKADG